MVALLPGDYPSNQANQSCKYKETSDDDEYNYLNGETRLIVAVYLLIARRALAGAVVIVGYIGLAFTAILACWANRVLPNAKLLFGGAAVNTKIDMGGVIANELKAESLHNLAGTSVAAASEIRRLSRYVADLNVGSEFDFRGASVHGSNRDEDVSSVLQLEINKTALSYGALYETTFGTKCTRLNAAINADLVISARLCLDGEVEIKRTASNLNSEIPQARSGQLDGF